MQERLPWFLAYCFYAGVECFCTSGRCFVQTSKLITSWCKLPFSLW